MKLSLPVSKRANSPRRSATPCHAGPASSRFLDDGHVEIDSNTVERAIRPLALNRKECTLRRLGRRRPSIGRSIASLIETCKLNGVDPEAYLADIFARLVEGHPINRIDELLPWNWAAAHQAQRAA